MVWYWAVLNPKLQPSTHWSITRCGLETGRYPLYIPSWIPSGYVNSLLLKMVIYSGFSGFTQLENGGSFHSYVTVYQLKIMFQCISHLIQWKKNTSSPQKVLWWGVPLQHIPSPKDGWFMLVYTLTCLAKPICWFHNCVLKKVIITTGWWFQPLRKIWKSVGMMTLSIYGKIKKCSKPPTSYYRYTINKICMPS